MKTITNKLRMLMIIGSLALSVPAFATITNPVTEAAVNNAATDKEKAEVMQNRLKEIKEMDRSGMSRAEKKELRKEVKEIKTSMKALSGGIYLSIGAILLIILLILIL
ncbi:MAG: hypothetical protein V4535_09785 [Bacteroidota bacterium]